MGQSPKSSTYNKEKKGLPFFQGSKDFNEKEPSITVWCDNPKRIAEKNNILLSVRAPVGDINLAPEKCCIGRGLASLKAKDGNYEYLYYLMKFVMKRIRHIYEAEGTVFGTLKKDDLYNIKVKIPFCKEEREIIGLILSLFDKKIRLNYQMNETLENISQAIFKSWFIDFEPFQEEEFVESEMGKIPENWKIHKYTEKFSVGGGGTPKTKIEDYWNGDIFWATGKDISQNKGIFLTSTERKITELGLLKSSAKLYPKDTTVITARGTVGELKILSKDIAISQTCYALLPKNENHHHYLYLLTSNMIDTLKRRAYGAIFDTITTRIFESYDIIYPPEKILNRFDEIVIPIYDKILINQEEIEKLNDLRELLLSQLISGRLRISNPDKFLEEIKN